MEFIIEFLQENWRFVAEIILTVIVLLVSLLRKKTTIKTDGLTKVLMALPGLISEAEKVYGAGNGETKFTFVFAHAYSQLQEFYSDEVIKAHNFSVLVVAAIENILGTPTKKER